MPQKTEQIPVPGYDARALAAICYITFLELKWPVLFVIEQKIVAATRKNWGDNITVESADGSVTITSRLSESAATDLFGKNKKNIKLFKEAFNARLQTTTSEDITRWQVAMEQTEVNSRAALAAEVEEAQTMDRVMNLSGSNLYVTYAIIAVNVLIFGAMAVSGISIFEPDGYSHLKWGSNYAPLTLTGDWWRLITSTFLHFGIIHIAFNMYALYSVSVYLEPMLGKLRFIIAYLCCGVLASIASLVWHGDSPVNSAGASGAIFGMYGLFIALLTTKLIPQRAKQGILQSLMVFVGFNLLYGMKGGIDNAAHVGGLLSGLVFGYLYYMSMRPPKPSFGKAVAGLLVTIITVAATFIYLQSQANHYSSNDRKDVLRDAGQAAYKDNDKYNNVLLRFQQLETKAVAPFDSVTTEDELLKQLNTVSIPAWDEAAKVIAELDNADISPQLQKEVNRLKEYIGLRKKHALLTKEMIIMPGNRAQAAQRDSIVNSINTLLSAPNQ